MTCAEHFLNDSAFLAPPIVCRSHPEQSGAMFLNFGKQFRGQTSLSVDVAAHGFRLFLLFSGAVGVFFASCSFRYSASRFRRMASAMRFAMCFFSGIERSGSGYFFIFPPNWLIYNTIAVCAEACQVAKKKYLSFSRADPERFSLTASVAHA